MSYVIKDWAGNTLINGYDRLPLEFDSFDEAWEYIHQTFQEDDFEDLFVEFQEVSHV